MYIYNIYIYIYIYIYFFYCFNFYLLNFIYCCASEDFICFINRLDYMYDNIFIYLLI